MTKKLCTDGDFPCEMSTHLASLEAENERLRNGNVGPQNSLISYKEMMNECKAVFNFSPCDEFKNVSILLDAAKKIPGGKGFYLLGASIIAEKLAAYLDQDAEFEKNC